MKKIQTISYSDGNLGIGYDNGNMSILNLKSSQITESKVKMEGVVTSIEIATNYDYLVACDLDKAILANWKTGQTIFSTQISELVAPQSVLFIDDRVVISGNSTALIYNVVDDTYYDQFPGLVEETVLTILREKKLMVCGDFTGRINLFDLDTYKRVQRYKIFDRIFQVSVSKNDEYLYAWHGSYASKWNFETGTHILNFEDSFNNGNDSDFRCGTLSYGENILITAGSSGRVHFFDTLTGQLIKTMAGHQGGITDFAIGDNSIVYTSGWDGAIRHWNTDTYMVEELNIISTD